MMPLNYKLRKYKRYRFTKLKEEINHFTYMEDINIFVPETLNKTIWIFSQNIGMEFRNEKCAMLWNKWRKRPT